VSDFAQVVILCEDRQQEVFARHFLVSCGVHPRRIRASICPKGKLAGEQYVRETFPKEVRAYRSRSAYLNIGLIVMTDADVKSVTERQRTLDDVLGHDGQARREAAERIAIFIPKRNVETWIHYLMGEAVNETDVYPKLATEGDCKPFVARVAVKSEYRLTADVPPSLRLACGELTHILPHKRCVQLMG